MGFEPTRAELNGFALTTRPPRRREKLRFVSCRSLPREMESGKQILSQNFSGKYGEFGHMNLVFYPVTFFIAG